MALLKTPPLPPPDSPPIPWHEHFAAWHQLRDAAALRWARVDRLLADTAKAWTRKDWTAVRRSLHLASDLEIDLTGDAEVTTRVALDVHDRLPEGKLRAWIAEHFIGDD